MREEIPFEVGAKMAPIQTQKVGNTVISCHVKKKKSISNKLRLQLRTFLVKYFSSLIAPSDKRLSK